MLGFDGRKEPEAQYGLLGTKSRSSYVQCLLVAVPASILLLAAFAIDFSNNHATLGLSKTPPTKWHGVSLGGWLVMEINPSHAGPDAPVDLRPCGPPGARHIYIYIYTTQNINQRHVE